MEKRRGGLYKDGVQVPAFKTFSEALDSFLNWLRQATKEQKVVLVAHNAKGFDIPILLHNAKNAGKLNKLTNHIAGYIDTLPLFRNKLALKNNSLERLAFKFGVRHGDHDALGDSECLRLVVEKAEISDDDLRSSFFELAA